MGTRWFGIFSLVIACIWMEVFSTQSGHNVKLAIIFKNLHWEDRLPFGNCRGDDCTVEIKACIHCVRKPFYHSDNGSCVSKKRAFDVNEFSNDSTIADIERKLNMLFFGDNVVSTDTQEKQVMEVIVTVIEGPQQVPTVFNGSALFDLQHPDKVHLIDVNGIETPKSPKKGNFSATIIAMGCNTNYYGQKCETYCDNGNEGYHCSIDGVRLCHDSWYPLPYDEPTCNLEACTRQCLLLPNAGCNGCGIVTCNQGFLKSSDGTKCELACNPSCQNHGVCVNGTCNCPPDFTGDSCETLKQTSTTSSSTSSPTLSTVFASTTTENPKKKLTPGVIAAIVVITVSAMALILYIIIRAIRKCFRNRSSVTFKVEEPVMRASVLSVENPVYEYDALRKQMEISDARDAANP